MVARNVEQLFELMQALRADLGEVRKDQKDQGASLHRIEIQTTKTDGRVDQCFSQIEAHDYEFRDLKSLLEAKTAGQAPAKAVLGAEPKEDNAIRLVIPQALWAKLTAGGLSALFFGPTVWGWFEKLRHLVGM